MMKGWDLHHIFHYKWIGALLGEAEFYVEKPYGLYSVDQPCKTTQEKYGKRRLFLGWSLPSWFSNDSQTHCLEPG